MRRPVSSTSVGGVYGLDYRHKVCTAAVRREGAI